MIRRVAHHFTYRKLAASGMRMSRRLTPVGHRRVCAGYLPTISQLESVVETGTDRHQLCVDRFISENFLRAGFIDCRAHSRIADYFVKFQNTDFRTN